MMSRPDFVSKQIIFIESDSSKKIKFRNSNFTVVDENNKVIIQHSFYKIFIVYVLGEFSITSVLIKNAKKYAVPIVFLNYNLKPYFSIIPDNKGNFILRKKQYANKQDLELAKNIVKNKVSNQIDLIKSLRYKTKKEQNIIMKAEKLYLDILSSNSSQELLGIEGNVSKIFFNTYFKNLDFNGRRPRAKDDVFNLLFDIGYFYLFNFIEANLELYGFDIYYGFYHKLFFQRKSLVCDLIEPFRCIIDKKIKKGFNLKQINFDDFYLKNGQYYIKRGFNKKYSRFFLEEILKHKEGIFLYIQKYYRCFIKNKAIDSYPKFKLESKK